MTNKLLPLFIIILCTLCGVFEGYIFTSLNGEKSIGKTSQAGSGMQALENNITTLVKEVSPSVVSIIAKQDMGVYKTDPWGFFRYKVGSINKKVGGGTGFFISDTGIIITNKHVIEDSRSSYTAILNDGTQYETKLIGYNKSTDIAFLQIINSPNSFTPLKFANSGDIYIGQFAIAIGNALAEFQNSVSLGVVSGLNRSIQDTNIKLDGLIQTDTAINPGNSGGPLLNIQGKVMGINTIIINGSQNIGFAIELSQEEINSFLEELRN